MNSKLFALSLIEIILSLMIPVIIIFISYKILKALFFKSHDIRGTNLSFTIFISGIILSIGLILSEILPSITNMIRLASNETETIELVPIIKYSGLYMLIGFIAAIIINCFVFILFSILTRGINEFKEIQSNNISVSILVVSILISITIIVKDSIALLVSSLVPYPEVTNFLG
jgi:uncharacterized membrane protein YjfL (UPF0719 family)